MSKKIFSIPLNPILSEKYFYEEYFPFLEEYKDWIYDVYFTCRIPPFLQDAMGAVIPEEERLQITGNAMIIQRDIGITVCATFNNINVSSKYDNYKLFIENLKPLYEAGLRSAIVPHGHWLAMGLKDYFPEMEIKNTILRRVDTAQDFVLNAEQGFDYINIDRILMRDYDELSNIKRAQKFFEDKYGRYIKIALLTNEGCLGRCPVMDEHHQYNNLKQDDEFPYFRHEISKVTCAYKWEKEDPAFFLRAATIPPFKKEYDELLEYVDIFKMHGRDSTNRLLETIDIIKNYVKGEEILISTQSDAPVDKLAMKLPDTSHLVKFHNLVKHGIPYDEMEGWRNKIKRCKFQCWDCNYCDVIAKFKQKDRPVLKH